MDWYYKGGLIVGLIWGALRALGVYGEAARDLDLNFLFAFLLTTGGWSAVFLVIDRVAKFFGWKRAAPGLRSDVSVAVPPPARAADEMPTQAQLPTQAQPPAARARTTRTARRSRR